MIAFLIWGALIALAVLFMRGASVRPTPPAGGIEEEEL